VIWDYFTTDFGLCSAASDIRAEAQARLTGIQSVQLKELRTAAPALKLKLEEIETQLDTKDLESAFQTAKQKQVNGL
jgi:hypothetical protein